MAKQDVIKIQVTPSTRDLEDVWTRSQKNWIGIGVLASANAVRANLIKVTPRRTGRLVNSQRLNKVGEMEREIVETVEYGRYLRAGVPANKINPIFPQQKKALFWPGARHPVKAVYNHPGIKKNDYWQTAIDMSEREIERQSNKVVADIEAAVDI